MSIRLHTWKICQRCGIGSGATEIREDEEIMKILVLNAGSSSQKIRLYELPGGEPPSTTPAPLWTADADWGRGSGKATITLTARGETSTIEQPIGDRGEILTQLLRELWQGKLAVLERPGDVDVIGHRVVHGGAKYQQSVLITPEVREEIRRLIPFAPLHQPVNLAGIETVESLFG